MTTIVLAPFGGLDIVDKLAARIGAKIGSMELRRFPDEESYVRIDTDVAGRDVVIVASLDRPDGKFLPLVFLARTARDLGAERVGLVCPYLPYLRQDARFRPGEGLTSAHFASVLGSEFDWLVTVDPHLHRWHSLSDIYRTRTRVVHAAPLISAWIRQHVAAPLVIGPDEEAEQWAASVGRAAEAPHVVLRKKRSGDYAVDISVPALDQWRERTPVLVDDIVSTARTMIAATRQLRAAGHARVECVCVHPLFAGSSIADLIAAGASRVVSTNAIAHATNAIDITELLVAPILELSQAVASPAPPHSGREP